METYKCDKCGKIITNNKDDFSEIDEWTKVNVFDACYDLCPNCYLECEKLCDNTILKWLNKKKEI